MGKRLFLLLLSSLFSSICNLNYLAATDSVNIMQPDFNAVEIIEIKPEIEDKANSSIQLTKAAPAPVMKPAPVYNTPANSISIAGRTIEIIDVPDTAVDAGNHVNKYGEKFLYGHNSNIVCGGLKNVGVGGVFVVNYNGNTTNYVVSKVVIYEKNTTTGKLQLNGTGNYMRQVANAKSEGVSYDLSIMTCYGTSYGNGDASHRYVIFANRI